MNTFWRIWRLSFPDGLFFLTIEIDISFRPIEAYIKSVVQIKPVAWVDLMQAYSHNSKEQTSAKFETKIQPFLFDNIKCPL